MKYTDYRKEDMVFLTKEDWTDEEMKEVLDTFPESCETEQIREALNKVLKAMEDDTIKTSTWGKVNKQSARAYADKHDYLRYGTYGRSYYDDTKYFYILIDATYKTLDDKWDVEQAIKYLDDIPKRFKNIAFLYRRNEEIYKNTTERENYEIVNRERIIANKIADCYLDNFHIEILKKLNNSRYSSEDIPSYSTERKTVRGNDYIYHNDYGEITFFSKPCSKEDAEKITAIMKEATRKAEMIMDRVDIELREIREKYREESTV